MSSPMTSSSSIVKTIGNSPTRPYPGKRSADPTVKQVDLETIQSHLPLYPTQTEPEVIDLVDTSNSTYKEISTTEISIATAALTQPDISIVHPLSEFRLTGLREQLQHRNPLHPAHYRKEQSSTGTTEWDRASGNGNGTRGSPTDSRVKSRYKTGFLPKLDCGEVFGPHKRPNFYKYYYDSFKDSYCYYIYIKLIVKRIAIVVLVEQATLVQCISIRVRYGQNERALYGMKFSQEQETCSRLGQFVTGREHGRCYEWTECAFCWFHRPIQPRNCPAFFFSSTSKLML